jgi:hypothetical protein
MLSKRAAYPTSSDPKKKKVVQRTGGAVEAGQVRRGNTTGYRLVSPWERRERGGLYYTRSKKANGKVVREYVGGGVFGELAARMDALDRRRREEEAAAWKEERERMEALDGLTEELYETAEVLAKAALLAAGYYQHKRGGWRKRRGK